MKIVDFLYNFCIWIKIDGKISSMQSKSFEWKIYYLGFPFFSGEEEKFLENWWFLLWKQRFFLLIEFSRDFKFFGENFKCFALGLIGSPILSLVFRESYVFRRGMGYFYNFISFSHFWKNFLIFSHFFSFFKFFSHFFIYFFSFLPKIFSNFLIIKKLIFTRLSWNSLNLTNIVIILLTNQERLRRKNKSQIKIYYFSLQIFFLKFP